MVPNNPDHIQGDV